MTVARRSVDNYSLINELLTNCVDVVDLVGEMAEVAAPFVFLGIPVVGELDERRPILLRSLEVIRRRQEDEGEAALLVFDPADFSQAEFGAIKIHGSVEIGDPHHRVQIFHGLYSCLKVNDVAGTEDPAAAPYRVRGPKSLALLPYFAWLC